MSKVTLVWNILIATLALYFLYKRNWKALIITCSIYAIEMFIGRVVLPYVSLKIKMKLLPRLYNQKQRERDFPGEKMPVE
jgi:predicted membrane protein